MKTLNLTPHQPLIESIDIDSERSLTLMLSIFLTIMDCIPVNARRIMHLEDGILQEVASYRMLSKYY